MSSTSDIAKFVRKRRLSLGLNQIDLAERAGVGLRFIRDLEQEKPTVRCDKVNQVLEFFGHRLQPVAIQKEDRVGEGKSDG